MSERKTSEAIVANWKCHTPNLLREILENPGTGILKIPIQIFGNLLLEVATRASELNDPILNDLMCRLTLYSIADPTVADFNPEVLKQVQETAKAAFLNKNAEPSDGGITIAEAFNQLANVADSGRVPFVIRLENRIVFQVDTPEFEYVEVATQPEGSTKAYASK